MIGRWLLRLLVKSISINIKNPPVDRTQGALVVELLLNDKPPPKGCKINLTARYEI